MTKIFMGAKMKMKQSISLKQKFDLLQTLMDESHIHLIIDKILKEIKDQHIKNLEKYNNDLKKFESIYGMKSSNFYEKFEDGQLGDNIDFFEWSGLMELRKDLINKLKVMGISLQ